MGALIVICGALCSTCGTLAVKKAANFRKLLPSLLAVVCYTSSTWFLAHAMSHMPVALAHAAWSGLVALLLLGVDRFYLKVPLASGQFIGFFCILAGIAALSAG